MKKENLSLSVWTRSKIRDVVKKSREANTLAYVTHIEIGRRLLIDRHCHTGMVQVHVFYKNQEDVGGPDIQGADEHVCPKCFYHHTGPHDFDGLVED